MSGIRTDGRTLELIGFALVAALILVVLPLALRQIRIVPHEEMPGDCLVFGGEGVERRHLVVVRQPIDIRFERIAALQVARIPTGFQQHDMEPGLRQSCRHRTAAGARADDDVVTDIVRHSAPA